MPKDSPKRLGIYVALFFIIVAVLVYFFKPSEKAENLPHYLGRMSALKAYKSCKTGKKCVKTHVITNLQMIRSNATELTTTPYTTIYSCSGDRLSACQGGRADQNKLERILEEVKNSQSFCLLYKENDQKSDINLSKGVFMNSDKIFGFFDRVPACDGYVSLVIEQYS